MPVLVWYLTARLEPTAALLHTELMTGSGKAQALKSVDEYVVPANEADMSLDQLMKLYPGRYVPESDK